MPASGRFEGQPGFSYIGDMGEIKSLLDSDILISDWSAMALEFAMGLEKPVLFIDVPRRIRNPNWKDLGLEPVEASIRRQLGEVLAVDRLTEAPQAIRRLLDNTRRFREEVRALREEMVFRLGHSVADGAAEISAIAAAQKLEHCNG